MEGPGGGVTGRGGARGGSRGRRVCCRKVKPCWERTGGHAVGSSLRLRPAGMLNLAALLWRRLLRKRWVLALVFGLSLVYFLSSTFKQVSDCAQDLRPSDPSSSSSPPPSNPMSSPSSFLQSSFLSSSPSLRRPPLSSFSHLPGSLHLLLLFPRPPSLPCSVLCLPTLLLLTLRLFPTPPP